MKTVYHHITGYLTGFTLFLLLIPFLLYLVSKAGTFPVTGSDLFRYILAGTTALTGIIFAAWSNVYLLSKGKGGPTDAFGVAISPRTERLVTGGPYRFSRNPMVFGAIALYIGISVFLNSGLSLAFVLVFFGFADRFVVSAEETRLERDFGQDYHQYKDKTPRYIGVGRSTLLAGFVLLWVYVILRAIYVPFIHDEIATFFRYILPGKFLPYDSEWSANNHILNSGLSWVFYKGMGLSEFSLRLANVLSFPVYLYFVWRFSAMIRSGGVRAIFLVVMTTSHVFIEFFSLSRGYGLSMALMMGGLWFTVVALRDFSGKNVTVALIFLVLMVLSNLTTVFILFLPLAMFLVSWLKVVRKRIQGKWSILAILVVCGVIPVVFFAKFLFDLQAHGELYKGALSGFWKVTVFSLAALLTGSDSQAAGISIALLLLVIPVAWIYAFHRKSQKDLFTGVHLPVLLVFAGNIALFIALRWSLKINYPQDRAALFLYPLFIMSLCFAAGILAEHVSKAFWILLIPLLYMPAHFVRSANLSYSSVEHQEIPLRFYHSVRLEGLRKSRMMTIGGYKSHELRWAMMNFREGGGVGKMQSQNFPSYVEDFQIGFLSRYRDWESWYDVIDSFPGSGVCLFKRKFAAKEELLTVKPLEQKEYAAGDEYINLFTGTADTLQEDFLRFHFRYGIKAAQAPVVLSFVVDCRNSEGKSLSYNYLPLHWYPEDFRREGQVFINDLIVRVPPETVDIIHYIWNTGKNDLAIRSGSLKISRIHWNGESLASP